MCLGSSGAWHRVPIGFGGGPATIEVDAYEELKKYLNISSKTVISVRCHVIPDEMIMRLFQLDFSNSDMYRQARKEAEELRKENYFAIATDLVCFGVF